jgi:exodeoxyribonuclease V alpha subunit
MNQGPLPCEWDWREGGEALEAAFAEFCRRHARSHGDEVFAAAFLVCRYLKEGKVGLDLREVAGRRIGLTASSFTGDLPEAGIWRARLLASGVAGHPGEFKPLILDEAGRLYLHKYHAYESLIRESIRKRLDPGAGPGLPDLDPEELSARLSLLFPARAEGKFAFQKVCCLTAAAGSFLAVSGGPGTGKTTVATKIISFLAALSPAEPLRVTLAAPTGKAAARLKQVVEKQGDFGRLVEITSPLTIHRLLGRKILEEPVRPRPGAIFSHGGVLIVDEASMIDLSLLARLFSVLPETMKIILLGDWRQLGAIEAGSPFADLPWSDAAYFTPDRGEWLARFLTPVESQRLKVAPGPPLQNALVELVDNWRFPPESSLGRMSQALVACRVEEALEIITKDSQKEITWRELRQPRDLYALLAEYVKSHLAPYFQALRRGSGLAELLALLPKRAVLSALKQGPYGALAVNGLLERMLAEQGFCPPNAVTYPGRPVMVTANDYTLELFNGDTGLTLAGPGASAGELAVYFARADNEIRMFPQGMLTSLETNYALTVHKAQGSEYEQVLVILPDTDSPVLTRELIYTAVTRARYSVQILGSANVLRQALGRERPGPSCL